MRKGNPKEPRSKQNNKEENTNRNTERLLLLQLLLLIIVIVRIRIIDNYQNRRLNNILKVNLSIRIIRETGIKNFK